MKVFVIEELRNFTYDLLKAVPVSEDFYATEEIANRHLLELIAQSEHSEKVEKFDCENDFFCPASKGYKVRYSVIYSNRSYQQQKNYYIKERELKIINE